MNIARKSLISLAGGAVIAAAGLAALPAAGAPQKAETILPGYWEYRIRDPLLGITLDKEMWCVRPQDVDKFLNGPCNRHHTCVYPTREVANGKAHFAGYWQNDEGKRANVEASGEYGPKRFDLRTKGTRGTNGAPIPPMRLDARWVSDTCQPGAKQVK